MKTRKLTLCAMFLAAALIVFVIESQLPPLAPIPGIKLGLANVIILMAIFVIGRKEALLINILRIVIGSIFAGNVMGFMYSLAGGLVSFAFMSIVSLFLGKDKLWVISILGAIGHNIGQILVAWYVTELSYIFWYLPVLMISGIITGLFTGITAQLTLKRLDGVKKVWR
ncbi:MAG: Gx transporter family protein [Oscillospiraceae bacterium]|nr:Gx transporter family protein [Oscillospiraceae bacterium]